MSRKRIGDPVPKLNTKEISVEEAGLGPWKVSDKTIEELRKIDEFMARSWARMKDLPTVGGLHM